METEAMRSFWGRVKKAVLAVGGVLLIVLAIGVGKVIGRAGGDVLIGQSHSTQMTADSIEETLEARPEFQGFFKEFKSAYPSEYNGLLAKLASEYNSGGQDAANRAAFSYMRDFMHSKASLIMSAPASDLNALASSYAALVGELRDSDVDLCAEFVMEGLPPGSKPSQIVVDRLNQINSLQLRAIRHAQVKTHTRGDLSEADATAWIEGMKAQDPVAASLVMEDALGRASPREQCDGGVTIYSAAARLPREQSANVTAYLLQQSLGAAS